MTEVWHAVSAYQRALQTPDLFCLFISELCTLPPGGISSYQPEPRKVEMHPYTVFATERVLVIFLNFTQPRVIWEEEILSCKLASIRLICEKLSWFWKIDECERAQFTVGGGINHSCAGVPVLCTKAG